MSRFRFIHASDLHLDTAFDGIAAKNERLAERLREASLQSWDRLVDLTIKRDASFLVLSGDLYDGPDRGLRAQLRFLKGLERLSERGISTFIVHGNHDPLEGWSAIRQWPEKVTVFGSSQVGRIEVKKGDQTIAQVYGISYAKSNTTENLALRFDRASGPGLHIGILHCNVGGVGEHAPYSPCSLDDLLARKMDYWALGHIHRREILRPGSPWIVYSGNLQGRSSKPSEQGAKGCIVVECDPSRVISVDFEPVDSVRFVQADMDVSEFQEIPDLERAILKLGDQMRAEHSGRDLVVRVQLIGRSSLSKDLKKESSLAELLRQLREECESLSPLLFWDRIEDRTRSELNLKLIRERGDLLAEIVKTIERFESDHYLKSVFMDRHLELIKKGELGRLLLTDTDEDLEGVLREALLLAADVLDPEVFS